MFQPSKIESSLLVVDRHLQTNFAKLGLRENRPGEGGCSPIGATHSLTADEPATKKDAPLSPEEVADVISATPDILSDSAYGVWGGD